MQRRFVVVGLAGLLAAPAFVVAPADAAIAFTCDSVTGSAVFSPGLVHDKRPQSLSSGPTAPAGPADLTVASTSDDGEFGSGTTMALSADGTKVALSASDVDPADTDHLIDIYVKDLSTGEITLASTSDAGIKGNDHSLDASLSADGTRVAFRSRATNLDPADTDAREDIYVKNPTTGDIVLASTSDAGVKDLSSYSAGPSLSADGTKVAFASQTTNLDPADTDTKTDVFVKDLTTGDIVLASTSDVGVKGNGYSGHPKGPVLSADGTKVAFMSTSTNLDPADTDSLEDIYVKDLTTGAIALASTSDVGVKGNNTSFRESLSADGTKVAFFTHSTNLDPADTDITADVYVKDLSTGALTLASTSDAGVKSNNTSQVPVLSADGSKVAFRSAAANLDPADTDFDFDIYVKNLSTGDITLASTSDTGVKGDNESTGPSLSADGTTAGFSSGSTNLGAPDIAPLGHAFVKDLPSAPTSVDIAGCSNGNSGTASFVDIRSYGPRPLGCPTSLGGAAGNDYADTTPILVGAALSMTIDWASGPNSYGVVAAKAGPTGVQWRFRLAITASPGHDTPATNQYLPAAGSGFTKTRLQGKFDVSALDSFNCTSGVDDPLSWVNLANNGTWVAKTS